MRSCSLPLPALPLPFASKLVLRLAYACSAFAACFISIPFRCSALRHCSARRHAAPSPVTSTHGASFPLLSGSLLSSSNAFRLSTMLFPCDSALPVAMPMPVCYFQSVPLHFHSLRTPLRFSVTMHVSSIPFLRVSDLSYSFSSPFFGLPFLCPAHPTFASPPPVPAPLLSALP